MIAPAGPSPDDAEACAGEIALAGPLTFPTRSVALSILHGLDNWNGTPGAGRWEAGGAAALAEHLATWLEHEGWPFPDLAAGHVLAFEASNLLAWLENLIGRFPAELTETTQKAEGSV